MRLGSLTTRFLLALLLSTALPFLLFGLYVRGEVRDREEQQTVSVYMPRWAGDAARKIAASLEYATRVGWLLAKSAERSLQVEGGLIGHEEYVYGLYLVNTDFDMVILADADGTVLSATRNPALDAEKHDELVLLEPKSVQGHDWFQRIQAGQPQALVERHFSPFLHRNPEQDSQDPTDYSLGLAFSVQNPRGEHGALYLLLQWQQVQEVLDEFVRFLRDDARFANAEAFLCDEQGRMLAHSDRGRYGRKMRSAVRDRVLRAPKGHSKFDDLTGIERGAGFARVPGFDWYVGVHAPTSELFEVTRDFGRWLALIIPLTALLLAGLAFLSTRAIIRPVRQLSAATRRISQGDLTTRVEARGGDELAELGRSFNSMAQDLAESRDRLRDAERQAAWAEMARQIAHEIKNPLTPMRMAAQMMVRAHREQDPRWEDLAQRLAKNVVEQTDALDRIARDFRQFAGSPAREIAVVSADGFLAGVVDLVEGMSEAAGISLRFSPGAPGARMAVDVQEMRRVFLNLVHNSVQVGSDVGTLGLSSIVTGRMIEFRVEDNGPGVSPEARHRLFEPYFTTRTSGTGLGLAICRKIVDAHHGEIDLEESGPGRTVFRVRIPLVPVERGGQEAG